MIKIKWNMLVYYLKRYPLSILVIGVICFLSFGRFSQSGDEGFKYIDKIAHFLMYGGLSLVFGFEYFRNCRKTGKLSIVKISIYLILATLLGGGIELLQEYGTNYRSGEWNDFFVDLLGSLVGLVMAYLLFRFWVGKK